MRQRGAGQLAASPSRPADQRLEPARRKWREPDRADRDSVLQVRRLRINAFVNKPFKVAKLLEQLQTLLPADDPAPVAAAEPAVPLTFYAHLQQLNYKSLDLPLLEASQKLLEQQLHGEQLDLRLLLKQFQHDSALCARLVAVANSPLYNSSGKACNSLYEALQLLGVNTSLTLALAVCLKRACLLRSDLLRPHAQRYEQQAEQLGEHVRQLALQLKLPAWPYQSAALLHRMGELCVLQQAQNWEDQGHSLDEAQLQQALTQFSREFAFQLKLNWHLPMPLREMIGAVYGLPPANLKRDLILMQLAAVELHDPFDNKAINRLRHMLGLPERPPTALVTPSSTAATAAEPTTPPATDSAAP
jgi:HD-like signal output (HDOD) protein